MVRYVFIWMPVFLVLGTLVVLSSSVLALIVFPFVLLLVLAGLVWLVVGVPYMLARAVSRRWHGDGGSPEAAAVAVRVERRD